MPRFGAWAINTDGCSPLQSSFRMEQEAKQLRGVAVSPAFNEAGPLGPRVLLVLLDEIVSGNPLQWGPVEWNHRNR